jgi:two-component system response regulator GlrR
MQAYPWPGNVRELESFVYRAFLVADGAEIRLDNIADVVKQTPIETWGPGARELSFHQAKSEVIAQFEFQYLSDLMAKSRGNVTAAAKLAGTERRYLGKLLKKHKIGGDPFRSN